MSATAPGPGEQEMIEILNGLSELYDNEDRATFILSALAAAKQETREEMRELLIRCEHVLAQFSYANPKWTDSELGEQDPCGVHKLREDLTPYLLPLSPPPPKRETHTADAETCPLCKRAKHEIPLTSDPGVEPPEKCVHGGDWRCSKCKGGPA